LERESNRSLASIGEAGVATQIGEVHTNAATVAAARDSAEETTGAVATVGVTSEDTEAEATGVVATVDATSEDTEVEAIGAVVEMEDSVEKAGATSVVEVTENRG